MEVQKNGAIVQMVLFNISLSEEELSKVATVRESQFNTIKGIIQKYYLKFKEHIYGGLYLLDSITSLQEYKSFELAGLRK